MAKVKAIFGQLRGKVGGIVFRGNGDGYTVASEYNAKPANPRTMAQTEQRNKMNLAGQISALTIYDAIAGLSSNKRKARSIFVSEMLKKMTTTTVEGGGRKATLKSTDLVLSKGLGAIMDVDASYATGTSTLTLSVTDGDEQQGLLFVRFVVYINDGAKYKWAGVYDTPEITGSSPVTKAVVLPNTVTENEGTIEVYAIPIFEHDAAVRTVYENGVNVNGTPAGYNAQVTRDLASLNAFGASQYVKTVFMS